MPTVQIAANAHAVVSTGWTSPSNAFSATGDNVYATTLNNSTTKNLNQIGDFGFPNIGSGTIPDGVTIDAVRIRCEADLSATGPGVLFGVLGRVSGADSGSETTKTTTGEEEVVATLGTVTLSDLRNASTVIKARCRGAKGNTSSTFTVFLDYVRLEVDYTEAGNQFQEALDTSIVAATVAAEILAMTEVLSTSVVATSVADDTYTPAGGGGFDPANLSAIQIGTDVFLDWDASDTPGVADYLVFRRTPQTGAAFDPDTDTPLASGITATEYTDEDPPPGDYDYQVFGRVPG